MKDLHCISLGLGFLEGSKVMLSWKDKGWLCDWNGAMETKDAGRTGESHASYQNDHRFVDNTVADICFSEIGL